MLRRCRSCGVVLRADNATEALEQLNDAGQLVIEFCDRCIEMAEAADDQHALSETLRALASSRASRRG